MLIHLFSSILHGLNLFVSEKKVKKIFRFDSSSDESEECGDKTVEDVSKDVTVHRQSDSKCLHFYCVDYRLFVVRFTILYHSLVSSFNFRRKIVRKKYVTLTGIHFYSPENPATSVFE